MQRDYLDLYLIHQLYGDVHGSWQAMQEALSGRQTARDRPQVVLRWLVQRGVVSLAKSVRKARMVENLNLFDFALTDDDVARLTKLETSASSFFSHRDPAIVKWMSERRLDV